MEQTAGSDYTGVMSAVLTFPPGSSNGAMECLNIDINDDNILEHFEAFTVHLTTSETHVTVNSNANELLANIRDNDGEKCLQFS